jgi:uncharacterized protein (TIGR02118 family)
MIRVTILYPKGEGKTFDMDYYAQKHMNGIVSDKLQPVRVEIDKPAATGQEQAFAAIGHIYFNSLDEFQKAFGAGAGEIMADIPNYTNIQPQIQISEIVE